MISWSEEQNKRRQHLIVKDIDGSLTAEETVELFHLEAAVKKYLDAASVLPAKELRKIYGKLLSGLLNG